MEYAKAPVPISGVCAVFAESEVINHVSNGAQPADIMHGAMESLIERSVRLMKRVQMEPQFTLVGGIMRFPTMVRVMREHLGEEVNVPPETLVQFTGAIGARRPRQTAPGEDRGVSDASASPAVGTGDEPVPEARRARDELLARDGGCGASPALRRASAS